MQLKAFAAAILLALLPSVIEGKCITGGREEGDSCATNGDKTSGNFAVVIDG